MRRLLIAAAIALGAAATPAAASEAYQGARALDQVEATYTRHNRDHRMWEIQRHQEMQRRHHYRGHYRGEGYGYRRHHGGPPPWAPAHGRRHHERYGRW